MAAIGAVWLIMELPLSKSKKRDAKPMGFINSVEPGFDPISAALRQMHDGIAKEPVPDDFMRLLDQLDERIAENAKKPS
jgi:Anti-sigma factor NepR